MNSFLSFWILSFLASPVLSPQTSWIPITFRYCAIRQIWNPKPTPRVFIFLDQLLFPLNNIPALFLLAQLAWAKVCQEWKPELLLPVLDLSHTYYCLIFFSFTFCLFLLAKCLVVSKLIWAWCSVPGPIVDFFPSLSFSGILLFRREQLCSYISAMWLCYKGEYLCICSITFCLIQN